MCGIACWFGDRSEAIANASELLRPRGPDGSRTLTFAEGTMCFHRLAVINLDVSGMQPFEYKGAHFIATGEIYNYRELSDDRDLRSDVDVILRLIAADDSEGGVRNTCRSLDGDFAFVYSRNQRVIAARDPVGVRPLFYGEVDGEVVAFASEAKALQATGALDRISVFPPGHFFARGEFIRYTDIYDSPVTDEQWRAGLVYRPLRGRRHVSRTRSACVFSVEFEHSASQDAVFAHELLKTLPRVQHTHIVLTEEQAQRDMPEVVRVCETHDPATLHAALPMFHLARHIAESTDYKVILSGEGADEVFLGYSYCDQAPSSQEAEAESRRLVENLHSFDLLRADRCFAAHGLEVRVPFLDRDLLRHAMSLSGAQRGARNGLEKSLLRDSFSYMQPLQKTGIINRGKMRLTDGVGFRMVESLVNGVNERGTSAEDKVKIESGVLWGYFIDYYGLEATRWIIPRKMPAWGQEFTGKLPEAKCESDAAAIWW
ncbi:nucleophile aminohydrolase [Tribonema minus]|uniref:asparagine synthase (glutamine-hydrolyzing) n=1 Tax=Tribonema minus TaxID=303371 RepID=A0A836CQR3_9STRA|nr:nucleophile aminohydrolase [Tribonema minus]